MTSGSMKSCRHISCIHIGGIVEFVIAHDSDPFGHTQTETRHGAETSGDGRNETNNRKKTKPIEEKGNDTEKEKFENRKKEMIGLRLQSHEKGTISADIHIWTWW